VRLGVGFDIFRQDRLDRPTLEAHAKAHRVCPFEFSLFLALWADVIVCDYNYAFDPRVFLRRFFDPPAEPYAFLVDEAHNLPDRAREMFSADLRRSEFLTLRRKVKTVFPTVARAISGLTPLFRRTLTDTGDDEEEDAARAPRNDPLPGMAGAGEGAGEATTRRRGRTAGGRTPRGDRRNEAGRGTDEPDLDGASATEAGTSLTEAVGPDVDRDGGMAGVADDRSATGRARVAGSDREGGGSGGGGQAGRTGAQPPAPPFRTSRDLPTELVRAVLTFTRRAETCLVDAEPGETRDALLETYFRALAFLRTAESFDAASIRYTEAVEESWNSAGAGQSSDRGHGHGPGRSRRRGEPDLRLRLFCLDPAPRLREALERAHSTVFFSATLLPLGYFFRLLGGREQDRRLVLASPFPPERLRLVVVPQIRTEYKVRERSHDALAELIHAVIAARRGNYLVYFPSFRYLNDVLERFTARHPDVRTIVQTPGMPEEAREAFLRAFTADNPETLVGFTVMGGIFGEGIDLRGERLIGSIIVGVGLPQICLERDLIRGHFQAEAGPAAGGDASAPSAGRCAAAAGAGFEIAYRYPGLNRVMQAAGRVIRTETDRGVVILVDERFTHSGYRRLFPREWAHAFTLRASDWPGAVGSLTSTLAAFWGTEA